MENFINKYRNLIRFILYSSSILLILVIFFFIIQTSMIWRSIISEIWNGLMPFLVSFFLAYIIHPVIVKLESFKIPRIIAISLLYLVIFGSLVLGISWLLPKLIRESLELGQSLPVYLRAIENQVIILEQYLGFDLSAWLFSESSTWMVQLSDNFEDMGLWAFDFLFYFIGSLAFIMIVPIALFYFLMDFEKIIESILKLLPKRIQKHIKVIAPAFDDTLGGYVRGLILVMLIVSLLATLLFSLFGIDYALLFGFFLGISGFIPVIGAIAGAAPVVIFALSISWNHVFVVILIQTFLQLLEGNILQPLIIGRKLEIHPLLLMMLMLIAGRIFGFIGVFFSVPVFLFIKIIKNYIKSLKYN